MGTTLASREDSIIDTLLEVLSIVTSPLEEDQTSTGTTEGLVATRSSVSLNNSETRESW